MDQQTKQWIVDRVMGIVGLVTALLIATQALAAEDERVLPTNDTTKSACGSSRVAYPYPPRLTPAEHAIVALSAAVAEETRSASLARSFDHDKD